MKKYAVMRIGKVIRNILVDDNRSVGNTVKKIVKYDLSQQLNTYGDCTK